VKAAITCEACGAVILEGERLYYGSGDGLKDDGIDGDYFDGGECTVCGRRLCGACGGFNRNGVCERCREEGGDE
jgi:hypothetical protein